MKKTETEKTEDKAEAEGGDDETKSEKAEKEEL